MASVLPAAATAPPPLQEEQLKKVKGTTFARTCLNVTNALSGMGVLSMPYALSEGGWLGLILFFVIAIICCYTGILMQRCMEVDQEIRTYPDIGGRAFGFKGRVLVSIFVYIELYLVSVSFLILEGDNLHKLFPDVDWKIGSQKLRGKKLFILLTGIALLPTTWLKNLSILAYVSACGLLASIVLLASLIWTGIADTGFHEGGRLFHLSGLPIAIGLFFVCFTAHGVIPTVHTSMKNPLQFPLVLLISFIVSIVNYGVMGVLGYLMFGDDVRSQVTLNLPTNKAYAKVAIYTTIIIPLAKYALVMEPIAIGAEEMFGFQRRIVHSILLRTCLVIGTVIIAIVVPLFGYVMSFTGSLLSVAISVLLPCSCYLKLQKDHLQGRLMQKIVIVSVMIFGVVVAAVGTYTSVKEIVHNL